MANGDGVLGRDEEPGSTVLGLAQSASSSGSPPLGLVLCVDNLRCLHCSRDCPHWATTREASRMRARRRFHSPARIVMEVRRAAAEVASPIDHVVVLSAAEPTLDRGLGELIDGLHDLDLRVAVVSTGHLLNRDDVRAELGRADWVSIAVDATDAASYRDIHGLSPSFDFDSALQGIRTFAASYRGTLTTQTTLRGTPSLTALEAIADLVSTLGPRHAYLAAARVDADLMTAAMTIFNDRGPTTRLQSPTPLSLTIPGLAPFGPGLARGRAPRRSSDTGMPAVAALD
ncbi:MAG: radical SAM protein [Myxococcales bacterium]|nr:radical SAM protein [Myxococcales bacterium]